MIHWIYRGPISVSTSWWHELPILRHYGWWTKSCTTWNVWNPINHGIFTISTFAGFLPSTVCTYICLGWIYHAFFVSGIFGQSQDWWIDNWPSFWKFGRKKSWKKHTPASSKWPFDAPNEGHLSHQKVTYRSKRGHFEEPGSTQLPGVTIILYTRWWPSRELSIPDRWRSLPHLTPFFRVTC